jgi:hypothetical protein
MLLLHCPRAPSNTSVKSVRLNSVCIPLYSLSSSYSNIHHFGVAGWRKRREKATDLAGENGRKFSLLRSDHICETKLMGLTQRSPRFYDRGMVSPKTPAKLHVGTHRRTRFLLSRQAAHGGGKLSRATHFPSNGRAAHTKHRECDSGRLTERTEVFFPAPRRQRLTERTEVFFPASSTGCLLFSPFKHLNISFHRFALSISP